MLILSKVNIKNKNNENRLKINITPYEENAYWLTLTETKFKIWRVTFMKDTLTLRNYGMDFWFYGNKGSMTRRFI